MANNDSNRNITNLIRDIVFYYIKYYYDKHLEENNISRIEDDKIQNFVFDLYELKNKTLKDYIRKSLKENLKEKYEKLVVENILMEMFTDVGYCKTRMIDEIKLYQYQQEQK
tara:strand:+ start:258 stop:593 length:336 start_codon:yes stop_codon:yes gene_type:complete